MKRTSSAITPGGTYERKIYRAKRSRKTPRDTTLTSAKSPFPIQKTVSFSYTATVNRAPATASDLLQVCPNDIFDFDYSNVLANKQPLYYDTFLSTNGPYKAFMVKRWELTYTIVNKSIDGIFVYYLPTTGSVTELDTIAEMYDFPGVKIDVLGANSSGSNKKKFTIKGNLADVFGKHVDESSCTGAFATSPSARLFSGIAIASCNGTTTLDYAVLIEAKMITDLFTVDAVIS